MLLLKPELMKKAQSLSSVEEIQQLLRYAVTLELATLPTYLTGIFSLKPGTNSQARALAQSVTFEEMLHLTLASNLLISIGGSPDIDEIGQSLTFPTPLPDNVIPDLNVNLDKMTKEQVYNVYMGIECPDTTAVLPGEKKIHPVVALRKEALEKGVTYGSIGDFYDAIVDALNKLVELHKKDPTKPNPFASPSLENQIDINKWFPPAIPKNPTGKVADIVTFREVVNAILREGEGAQIESDPIDPKGGLNNTYAHYFKFAEIYYGKKLVKDPNNHSGWSYSGEPVPLDEDGVYNFKANAALSDYTQGTAAYNDANEFYGAYLRLLKALDESFNGKPDNIKAALGIMYELILVAGKVVIHPFDPNEPNGYVATPPFMETPED